MKKFGVFFAFSVACALYGETFDLGQIEVSAKSNVGANSSDATVAVLDEDYMQKMDIKRVSDTAKSIPGVYLEKKGGRAESGLYVRGFNSGRVPLFIDGIPVYVPYDGNADLGRFTTFDLSEIDVSKGSSSVLYGANTMGGAINLVTKKPTKALEGSLGYGLEFGKSSDTFGNNIDFNIGSLQELFYIQTSGSFVEDKGEQLSSDYETDINKNEDGGRRGNSAKRDKKINLKFGFTPNETDEYTVAYVNQKASKEQPLYAGRFTNMPGKIENRFWDWNTWDRQSLYFLSRTEFENSLYFNTKAFYDEFENSLSDYNKKSLAKNQDSGYKENAHGFGVEIGGNLGDADILKFATNYKRDKHKDTKVNYDKKGVGKQDPQSEFVDRTYSFGLENTYRFSDRAKFIAGVSYDVRDAVKARDYVAISKKAKALKEFSISKKHALNYQAALKYSFDRDDELSISYARKTYFPSMKDRYSERFGKNTPNPYLNPEIANHYEIGYGRNFGDLFRIDGALFYSRVKDAIGGVKLKNKTEQNQNINKATHRGFELGAVYSPTNSLEIGGNYTYINAKYGDGAKIYDLPKHKGFAYLDYKFTPKFYINLSQQAISSKYVSSKQDVKLSGFGVTSLKLGYEILKDLNVEAGIANLFDKNYEFAEGYPEEGRVFFSNIRYKF